ncbi:hypothetical protein T492DRAFT_1046151, partial [Pavlovales sp. CCMP2436]
MDGEDGADETPRRSPLDRPMDVGPVVPMHGLDAATVLTPLPGPARMLNEVTLAGAESNEHSAHRSLGSSACLSEMNAVGGVERIAEVTRPVRTAAEESVLAPTAIVTPLPGPRPVHTGALSAGHPPRLRSWTGSPEHTDGEWAAEKRSLQKTIRAQAVRMSAMADEMKQMKLSSADAPAASPDAVEATAEEMEQLRASGSAKLRSVQRELADSLRARASEQQAIRLEREDFEGELLSLKKLKHELAQLGANELLSVDVARLVAGTSAAAEAARLAVEVEAQATRAEAEAVKALAGELRTRVTELETLLAEAVGALANEPIIVL